jgi:hypothetical protein
MVLTRSADFVPRDFFSPSALQLSYDCERAWGYRYLLGLKIPELSFADIEAGVVDFLPRQRSAALGKAGHAVAERYYAGLDVDWSTTEARIILPAFGYVPHPSEWSEVHVEHPVQIEAYPRGDITAEPIGFSSPERPSRKDLLGIVGVDTGPVRAGSVLLVDWKTTASFNWAKPAERLIADIQANVYTVDAWDHYGAEVHGRWVYVRTRGAPKAMAVDFKIPIDIARRNVESYAAHADGLRSTMRAFVAEGSPANFVDQMTPNLAHCKAFGGCPHHFLQGGNCNGTMVPHREISMGIRDQVAAIQQQRAATPAPAAAAPIPPPATPVAAKPRAVGRPRAAAPAPAPAPEPPPVVETPAAADGAAPEIDSITLVVKAGGLRIEFPFVTEDTVALAETLVGACQV